MWKHIFLDGWSNFFLIVILARRNGFSATITTFHGKCINTTLNTILSELYSLCLLRWSRFEVISLWLRSTMSITSKNKVYDQLCTRYELYRVNREFVDDLARSISQQYLKAKVLYLEEINNASIWKEFAFKFEKSQFG